MIITESSTAGSRIPTCLNYQQGTMLDGVDINIPYDLSNTDRRTVV